MKKLFHQWQLINEKIHRQFSNGTARFPARPNEFAKTIADKPDEDLSIIMQSRKTLLFREKVWWVKKERDQDFDVPMGCYDGAEVCEIVGSYILNLLIFLLKNFYVYIETMVWQ